MAWIEQEFHHAGLKLSLQSDKVQMNDYTVILEPANQDEAHAWAMMLRKAARRLEEIGKVLP